MSTPAPRTAVLALGAFAVGTSGYVIAGLLPALTEDLAVSEPAAAQLVTAFAIAYAVGSPLFGAATGRWERRRLLVAALAIAALGNALAALAPNYALLLLARVVTAIGAAVFTPVASAVAAELNPPERRGRAVALVFGGLTFAMVAGVPLGNLLADPIGYRGVFGLVAAFSLGAAVAVGLRLPSVAAPPAVGLAARFAVARDPRVLAVLCATVLGCLAAFSVYTFITPVLGATAGVSGSAISVLLLCYGVGAALGNVVGGRAADRWGTRRPLYVVVVAITVTLALLPVAATTVAGAATVQFLWGVATWSFNPPVQHRLITLSPAGAGLLLSLNASAIYLGVGLSGVVGGLVLRLGGPALLPEVAALLTLAAGVFVALGLRDRNSARGPVAAQSV
ncbi:MFS transporter [Prauserella flavalba]|uniref:MFS transporter n=1 Tax=Prauserella flavalba TaxID=1477506 RepID=A0A318LU89_9PSEU|nr:MFS transporter [Prauserella flavalba]PXY38057.1 MFS transporter [Prauserella flavalba]